MDGGVGRPAPSAEADQVLNVYEASSEIWPVVARWKQPSDGGTVSWYLASLGADRRFWGYVHFRTTSRQENRNFSGTLDEDTFNRVESLIQELVVHADLEPKTAPLDGLVGIGTRSSFRQIFGICGGEANPDDASVIHSYHELLNVLQPKLADNIQ